MVYFEFGVAKPEKTSSTLSPTQFRSLVSGEAGSKFPAEAGRYHLIVSYGCPFAHRALLLWTLKGLQDVISLGVVSPVLNESQGWHFVREGEDEWKFPESKPDKILTPGAKLLSDYYLKADEKYTGKITVPVLWDKKSEMIVNNESADIMQILNSGFSTFASPTAPDFYPAHLQKEVDEVEKTVLEVVFGVYKAGFAESQAAYETACKDLFASLQHLEDRLAGQRYLVDTAAPSVNFPPGGPGWPVAHPTAADLKVLTVLLRFDPVYYHLFKCNLAHIRDFPNLHAYMKDLYTLPGVADTFKIAHVKAMYFSMKKLNPKGIVPAGDEPFTPPVPIARRWLGLPEAKPSTAPEDGKANSQTASQGVQGSWQRPDAAHRGFITADGSSGFKAERGRYHLYLANNCPWCHRVALTRAILGLEDVISRDVVWYRRDPDHGWQFNPEEPGCTPDTVNGGIKYIEELYLRAGSKQRSVPVLWDKLTATIVSNESADIIRMLATAFTAFQKDGAPVLYPSHLAKSIDEVNEWVYECINNGAYKASFASSQQAYELAYSNYFAAMDRLELRLSKHKWLMGEDVTEADVRLFPTIFRFDHVYFVRFQLNKAMVIESYPNLQRWLLDFYQLAGIKEACNIDHCKKGYFGRSGNNLVPLGPALSYKFDA